MKNSILLFVFLTACIFPHEPLVDADGDGYWDFEDCNDSDASINPGAEDIMCEEVDRNCDENVAYPRNSTFTDADGDGFGDPEAYIDPCAAVQGVDNRDDCNDADPEIHPELEDPADGVDNDCDGEVDEDAVVDEDLDDDGYGVDDCDDTNAGINPDAEEICDGVDNDCNGLVDDDDTGVASQATWYVDVDHDGYGTSVSVLACEELSGYSADNGDCNDENSDIHPGADEWDCLDVTDYNCDGQTGYTDADLDCSPACEDCNDQDKNSYPGASEVCDNADNDCNNIVDDPGTVTGQSPFYADLDHDSYGDLNSFVLACSVPNGYTGDSTDCDDGKTLVHPGGVEVCDSNSVDEDCDGTANDADSSVTGKSTFNKDVDGDGYGGVLTIAACVAPPGYVALIGDCDDSSVAYHPGAPEASCTDSHDYNCDGVTGYVDQDGDGSPACEDCNDNNPSIHTGATELCNGVDDNCNGTVDGSTEATNTNTYYLDADGDTFGKLSATTKACSLPSGYSSNSTDCDDSKVGVNPSAVEVCNSIDDNCNGLADDADPGVTGRATYYRDADGDTFGSSSTTKLGCVQPPGYVVSSTDCNDVVSAINPSAVEICDVKDNDCDGFVDDQDPSITGQTKWYVDTDGDGYGNPNSSKLVCSQPANYVVSSTDCDDAKSAVNPSAVEICDGIDNNCVGGIDDGLATSIWYADVDGDGYRNVSSSVTACARPAGYVASTAGADCDDTNSHAQTTVGPEVCDGFDNNCDGNIDETFGTQPWYPDTDGDMYGLLSGMVRSCYQLPGYVDNKYDCDDTRSYVHPSAQELCNGIDDNCNVTVDENCI